MPKNTPYRYQLFISYTRTPDGQLAREVERFLESFHQNSFSEVSAKQLPVLEICLDGSDFSLPPLKEGELQEAVNRDVIPVLHRYLAQSKEILLFCSQKAAQSIWVAEEIRWFLEHRGPGAIRLAFTEGDKPWEVQEQFFAKAIIDNGLTTNIAYDFRGYDERRSADWYQVPDFKKELVRLAADLHGLSASDLYPSWLEAQLERARAESLNRASTARFETLAGDPADALLKAFEAHQIHPSEITEQVLRDAYRVAILHHFNRRALAQFTGAGPGYLASRWKQGEVFVKSSPDGKYRLLVTERGKDGASPPGEVYLVSNETQRVVHLLPVEDSQRRRVEEVAFSQDSQFVFVTRYFHMVVYDLTGQVMGTYAFSRHTKSPVHLLAGYFLKRFIIGCETKGGMWLVDPDGDRNSTIQVLAEWKKDAALQLSLNSTADRALVVFESGRVALLRVDEEHKATLLTIPTENTLFAVFEDGKEEVMVTAGSEGLIQWWQIAEDEPKEILRSESLGTAIDWLSISDEHRYLAAVGANQTIYLVDRVQGVLLHTLNYEEDIDWGAMKKVLVPNPEITRLPAAKVYEEKEYPVNDLQIEKELVVAGEKWLISTETMEGQIFPIRKAWRVEKEKVKCYATYVDDITIQQDIYLMNLYHSLLGKECLAFCNVKGQLRRLPDENTRVRATLEWQDGILLGTDKGAYYHSISEDRKLTEVDVKVEKIEVVDDQVWLATRQGGYTVESDRVVRVTEPFVWVRAVQSVAGQTWLLTTNEGGGFSNDIGPCYVINGYHAQVLPDQNAKVWNVVEAGGITWIVAENALYEWSDNSIGRIFPGLDTYANELIRIGDSLWVTTRSRGFMPGPGPFCRIDLVSGVVEKSPHQISEMKRVEEQVLVEYYEEGKKVTAKLGPVKMEVIPN